MLSFGAEYFVFQFAIRKYKDLDIEIYNFAVVFYGCETWSLTLREERRLRVFENRVFWSRKKYVGPTGVRTTDRPGNMTVL